MKQEVHASSADVRLDAEDWVTAFFETADKIDADATGEWFAPNIDMRFANQPPASTKKEAREGLRQFMLHISGMVHEPMHRVVNGNDAVQMATVIYTMPDGSIKKYPVASYLRRNDQNLLDRLWIFVDLSTLF